MSKKEQYTIEDLIKKASVYIPEEENLEKIRKAYVFAEASHRGQFRKSGEPYIIHPLNTAIILTTVYADTDTLIAGLLHDTIEDCDVDKDELEEMFGKTVANLVNGVSKLGRINFSTENEYLIDYYKKIIVGMSEDVRVIIVKLADRLHNMRTLYALPPEKQKKIAKETLEILAPIAHHLGIHKIKSELEDLSLRYLKPDVFYDIAERLDKTKIERDNTVNEMLNLVSSLLTEHNIPHEIKGRAKSIYSIYNKLNKGKKFSDIYDLLALRVLVDTEQECYLALGIIHSKFKPIPNRFKDYVAMPKANMYQSLHTTVFGVDGYLFEIQIRTYQMDEVAENGIASHWAYKEHKDAKELMQNTTEQKLQFFKSIIELNEDKMSSEDFVNSVKDEVLNNNIYCFTPKGDIIELPRDATPIDFAYKVHTRVGETMVGAIVNNSIVPLDYKLKNNDIVKINTSKNSKGPSQEWLNIVKSTQTKNKIRAFFSKNEKEIYIDRGKDSLEKELRKKKISFSEFSTPENTEKIFKELKIDSIDDLYLEIGNGKHNPTTVINIIYKKEEEPKPVKKPIIKQTDSNSDVVVAGIDKVKVNLANCCNPIPDDEIIGYITKGNGISVHRKECHNLEYLDNRTVSVSWSDNTKDKYETSILIHTKNESNNLIEVIQKLGMFDIHIERFITLRQKDEMIYEVDLFVKSLEYLNKVFREIEKLSYITKIERLMR
ncbi:MAG: bifunctional (p)ppGpp synthetase/guanosine-3',5'-bis(diphosphate) 3'-pyrophosphohydrolase [Tenericutes bacterium]|nr:bifunctional (p)ppGpp synthetase/guanosine-3',5'-bis(diphosphate) 3'-pyrophosphohydrolase [Mycoplasmatota bacterium]